MKRVVKIIISAVVVFSFAACNDGSLSPEMRSISASAGFPSEDGDTKALLEPAQLLTSGTEVMFYGLATDSSTSSAKDIPGHTSSGDGTTRLNDGQTIRYNGTGWAYTSGEDYQWLSNADFRFFGWLAKDAASSLTASEFFGTGFSFSPSTGVLTIPSKTLTITDGGLDFAYSDVVARSSSDADYSTVGLTLEHLFTSFSVSAHNYTSSPIVIKSVKLYGIRNQKSATVTFGANGSTATYSGGSTEYGGTNTYFELVDETSGISLEVDEQKANIINGASDNKKYILMWPQTAEELDAESSSTAEFLPTGTNPAYMQVVYSQNRGADMTVNVRLPFDDGIGWAAGTRHNMGLAFFEKKILLNVTGTKPIRSSATTAPSLSRIPGNSASPVTAPVPSLPMARRFISGLASLSSSNSRLTSRSMQHGLSARRAISMRSTLTISTMHQQ